MDRHNADPADRAELTDQDLAIATLVGRYIERREARQPPCTHDLFAVAAEFGDSAVERSGPCSPATRRCAQPKTTRRDPATPTPAPQEVSHAHADKAAVDTLRVAPMSGTTPSPIVTEVVRFEDLPPGSRGTRRAIARWSDGTESEALTWYADEILICEGDLIGKTQDQLRSVHFRRDRDWLQS